MLKKVFFALIGLAVVLLIDLHAPSAQATVSNPQVYTWGYRSIGSQEMVCKKIVIHPQTAKFKLSERLPAQLRSTIVRDRFCAGTFH